MNKLTIINKKGEAILTIEGPIFPRQGVGADYLGYWVSRADHAEGEGMLLSADRLVLWAEKLYKEEF